MTSFKPMLAGKYVEAKLRFPIIVQAKLDGIRASVVNGKLVTRTLKPVPSHYIRSLLERPEYEGLDGELIVGDPTADDVYRKTVSGVMAEDKKPDFAFYVFDKWDEDAAYALRWRAADRATLSVTDRRTPYIALVHYSIVYNNEGLQNEEVRLVEAGYEGAILRDPNARYKFGRGSTTKQELLKVKRFVDFECEVIGVEEEMHNANESKTNALGRTERSSHKAGKVGKGTLGALYVRRLSTGVEFKVGTGFSAAERQELWNGREALIGELVKVKSFPIGEFERPRHPVYVGMRSRIDM